MGVFEFVVSDGPGKGQTIAFPTGTFVIGSSAECQVRFDPSLVQPRHAEISVVGDAVSVRDLTASNLVWFNGENRPEGQVTPGAFVRLGRLELVVRQVGQSNPNATISMPTPMRAPEPVKRPKSDGVKPIPLDATAKRPTPFASAAMQAELGAVQARGHGAPAGQAGSLTELAPGITIDGRYLIINKIAAGGMGEVYKAEHVELGKLFAIKVMLPELSRDAEFVARFKREAISASRIGQQNIVDISDFGQTANGRFYFVMEFLDGLTLASVTHREGAIRVDRVLNVALQVTRALAAAHAQGIVHRDLKPENIMLLQRPGQPDFVKVLDFGVAKVAAGHGQGGHTAIGMVVGTPQYMSPEQAKAIPVDARSDVYSLGLIFYELLTGRPTFTAETPSMLMVKHVTEAPPPFEPGPLGEVPVELEALIFKMLEKEPDGRPQTMEQVVSVLDTIWVRFKANDPTLRRISGEFAPATALPGGPVSGKRKALPTDFAGKPARVTKTPARPSEKSRVRAPVVEQPASGPEDSQQAAQNAGADADSLVVKRSSVPYVVIAVLLAIAMIGGVFVLKGPPATATNDRQVATVADPEPVVAVVVAQKPSADPVKRPAPVASTVTLTIESVPTGAEISEGDVLLGRAPLALTREVNSKAALRFSLQGYESRSQTFGFVSTQTMPPVELKKEFKQLPKTHKKSPDAPQDDLKDFQ